MGLQVNGEAIDDEEIREEARNLRPRYMEAMGGGDPIALEMQLREWCRENVIERVLLRQEAARAQMTPEALVAGVVERVPVPKYKEVGEFYRKMKDSLWMPERIHAAHVIKYVDENKTEAESLTGIQVAEAELKAGAPFDEVAERHSDCGVVGIDLGWFERGKMVPEFDEVVFALPAGQNSAIFRTVFGYHIARVKERQAEGVPGLMLIREQIEQTIRNEKQTRALEAFVDELRARATITD